MRIAVYGSLLCGCRAVWAANGRTTCCTFFLSRWVETEELAGTDSAGVKLCCSHAWACATCHGERGSEDTKQTLQQKVLDIPLQKGLMKRVWCFLSRQEEAVKPCLLWEKGNICPIFISLHFIKIRWNFCFCQRLGWLHSFWGWKICSAVTGISTKRMGGRKLLQQKSLQQLFVFKLIYAKDLE